MSTDFSTLYGFDRGNRPTDKELIDAFVKFYDIEVPSVQCDAWTLSDIETEMLDDMYLKGMPGYFRSIGPDTTVREKLDKLAEIFVNRPKDGAQLNKMLEEMYKYYITDNPTLPSINEPFELYRTLKDITGIQPAAFLPRDEGRIRFEEVDSLYEDWLLRINREAMTRTIMAAAAMADSGGFGTTAAPP